MAVAFRSAASALGTKTCSKPAGLAVGDLLIAHILNYDNGGSSSTAHAGWTLAQSQQGSPNGTAMSLDVLWKVATSTEVAASNFTFTINGSYQDVILLAYSGVDGTTPINVSAKAIDSATTTHTVPAVTTTIAGCVVLNLLQGDTTGGLTKPSANTERYNVDTDDEGSDFAQATAGTTAARTAASGNSTILLMVTLAIAPPGGGGAAITLPHPMIVPQAVQRAAVW